MSIIPSKPFLASPPLTTTTVVAGTAAALAIALLTIGCAGHDDDHSHDDDDDPFVEACEHLAGPATITTATASPAGAPLVSADHKRHDIVLPDAATGGKSGVVSVNVGQAGHLHVFLSAEVPLKIANASGITPPGGTTSAVFPCAALKAAYEFDVSVGRHDLTLGDGSNTTATVGLVIETEAH